MEGGQGYVYVCHDKYLDRKVAIKVMRSKAAAGLLKKELRAICEIRSRHVAEVYDLVSSHGGTLGLVQEFVPGSTLAEHVRGTDLAIDELLLLLFQISAGLSDIHSHGRVHRDIKPQNLKFDAERVVKILDFGFATDVIEEGETTKARGTLGFLGPEFYGTSPMRFTSAADVYAFGATAWCLANKGHLHRALAESPPQSTTKAPSFSTIAAVRIPPEIAVILDATLAPDAKSRPAIGEVKESLERRLLYGRHRALFSLTQRKLELSEPGKSVVLKTGMESITVGYDGLSFLVTSVNGNVYINNRTALEGATLPKSCVVTLGASSQGSARTFVAVDTSHPEVVL